MKSKMSRYPARACAAALAIAGGLEHKSPDRQQYKHDYSGISHVCGPMSAILNCKPEQEWYREKKESDVT